VHFYTSYFFIDLIVIYKISRR